MEILLLALFLGIFYVLGIPAWTDLKHWLKGEPPELPNTFGIFLCKGIFYFGAIWIIIFPIIAILKLR